MRVRVLGPVVAVGEDGDAVSVAGRPRLLLALLAASAGRVVGVDRLVDDVWPDGTGSRAALQVQVHRVRRRVGADAVRLAGAGYVLDADVDAVELEREVRAGCALLPDDPAAALTRLSAALGLWRGEPFDGLAADHETLAVEAMRLGELRAEAIESRFEAALALGRAADLVGELRSAVAQAPLRERLHASLMVALHRSGRTAEALEAFRAARALLVEELGIEPGAELRALERAILTQDDELSAPPPPRQERQSRGRPFQVPAADPVFVGRERERERVGVALRSGSAVVAVDGPGGVGKSALAVAVAHDVSDDFPGGVLYVNLHGATPGTRPRDPAAVLQRLARALGEDALGDDLEEASAQFRSATAGAGVLVVLDDAATAAQVRPLLPGSGSAALVTSRQVLTGLTPHVVHVEVLGPGAAREMLGRLAGAGRVFREPEAAAAIVTACGRLPLALRIVGARLAATPSRSLTAMVERLEDTRARLDELEADDLAVRSSLEVGLDVVHPEAARLFALLGVVALPHVSAPAAARLADLPLGVARRRLDDLATAQLLAVDGDERFLMHDLVRLVAVERAAGLPAAERDAARERLYLHFLASARNAGRGPSGSLGIRELGPAVDDAAALAVRFADAEAAAQWVREELGALVALAESLGASGWSDPAVRDAVAALSAPLFFRLLTQGLHVRAAPLFAAYASGVAVAHPTRGDAVALVDASALTLDQARKDALAVAAEHAARALGDPELLVNALNVRGIAAMNAERNTEALAVLGEAVDVCLSEPRLHNRAQVVRKNVANVLGELGRTDEAIAVLEAILEVESDIGRAEVLADIATFHREAGRAEEAHELFLVAVPGLVDAGYDYHAALYAWNHANALRDLGRTDEELARRWESLRIAIDLGLLTEEQAEEIMAGDHPDDIDVFDGL